MLTFSWRKAQKPHTVRGRGESETATHSYHGGGRQVNGELSLTTNSAKRITPQLHASAFLPSYFSPCGEREQRDIDEQREREQSDTETEREKKRARERESERERKNDSFGLRMLLCFDCGRGFFSMQEDHHTD